MAYFPAFIFASLRGNAGTDTEYYRELYERIDSTSFDIGLDPLFSFSQFIFINLGLSFQSFALFQAFLCWIFFSYGASRIDKTIPILSVSILPVLFVDSTFNGLRYGISFAVAACLLPIAYEWRGVHSHLLRILPGFIHSSMFLVALTSRYAVLVLVLVLFIFSFTTNFDTVALYLNYKLDAYSQIDRPSWFSGLVPLTQIIFCLYLIKLGDINFGKLSSLVYVSFILTSFSILLSFYTVASMRLIQIALYILVIAIGLSNFNKNINRSKFIILLIGIFVALNFFRQIVTGAEIGNVKFIPYDFFWEL